MKILHILCAAGLIVSSCNKDERFDTQHNNSAAVQFSAENTTRVTAESQWQADDRIGIFAGDIENAQYKITADNNGTMEFVSGNEIFPPQIGETQNYYAYYPYNASLSGEVLSIDLTNTENQKPLLWAKTENISANIVALQFAHQLVKLNLTFSAGGDEITTLDGATAILKGANTKGQFNVTTGVWNASATQATDLPLSIATTNESITLTTYVMAATNLANVFIEIDADGNYFRWKPTTAEWVAGGEYDYNITVGKVIPAGGYEVINGTWEIYTTEGLDAFCEEVNNGNTSLNATLMRNITYAPNPQDATATNFTMINRYSGTFDGNDKTISGVVINESGSFDVGIFGYLYLSGEIKNLGVINSKITGENSVGGIVGSNRGTLASCYNSGTVSGYDDVGGIVGNNYLGTLTSCYNSGTVSGYDDIGGIVGSNMEGTHTSCYNSGAVSGQTSIGGIVGDNRGTLTSCYNSGAVSGEESQIGGIVGENSFGRNSKGTLSFCYNSGAVGGDERASDLVGGIAGFNGGTLASCYNSGAVSGSYYIGGVVGYNYRGTLTTCCWVDILGNDAYDGVGRDDGVTNVVTKYTTKRELNTLGIDLLNGGLTGTGWIFVAPSDIDNGIPSVVSN